MKPITIYWSENAVDPKVNNSFLYPSPTTLMHEIIKNKEHNKNDIMFTECPAVSNKFKKTLVFKNPMSFKYEFDVTNDLGLRPVSDNFVGMSMFRDKTIVTGPLFNLHLSYLIFADEAVSAYFTPPFFHKPKYMRYASVVPGEFDIGQWFRPYNMDLQVWSDSGVIEFEEGEPLFYVELKTERPIVVKRFEMTDKLLSYYSSAVSVTEMFGRGRSLKERYRMFKDVGMRSRVIKEIQNNLLD